MSECKACVPPHSKTCDCVACFRHHALLWSKDARIKQLEAALGSAFEKVEAAIIELRQWKYDTEDEKFHEILSEALYELTSYADFGPGAKKAREALKGKL